MPGPWDLANFVILQSATKSRKAKKCSFHCLGNLSGLFSLGMVFSKLFIGKMKFEIQVFFSALCCAGCLKTLASQLLVHSVGRYPAPRTWQIGPQGSEAGAGSGSDPLPGAISERMPSLDFFMQPHPLSQHLHPSLPSHIE